MSTGTCVRNARGETVSAVAWIDGKDVFVQITIVDITGTAIELVLPGLVGMALANDLGRIIPYAEVAG